MFALVLQFLLFILLLITPNKKVVQTQDQLHNHCNQQQYPQGMSGLWPSMLVNQCSIGQSSEELIDLRQIVIWVCDGIIPAQWREL